MRVEGDSIIFDNLVSGSSGFTGESAQVKVRMVESFSQPNASGDLWQPKDIEDLSKAAQEDGELFIAMFQSK